MHFGLLFNTLIAMSLVIGSGCVLNNYIDRDIDLLMERTRNRVLVKGLMSTKIALLYAVVLGILGFALFYFETNPLTFWMAFIGWFVYVVVYSLAFKRRSNYGTLIGAIAGAIPLVVGYCAVTNRFDLGAILLFLILFIWQMPHFYAIAIYRLEDFKAAAIPVLPLQRGFAYTKKSILVYTVLFTIVAVMPTVFHYAGVIYGVVALALGIMWFVMGLQGFHTTDDRIWARKMFLFSILNITVLCIAMAFKA